MKNLSLFFLFLIFSIVITGCSKDDEDGEKSYESFGNWPEYAGTWRSGNQLVGEKWATATYLSITINDDGTFNGTYESYYQSGSMGINVGIITVYYPVYDPAGDKLEIFGALDFSNSYGIATFKGIGEVEFSIIEDTSDGELWFYFDTDFYYDMGYVK